MNLLRAFAPLLLVTAAGCLAESPEDTGSVSQDLNGDTWTTVDDNPYTAGTGAQNTGVAASSNGDIWVVGARSETTPGVSTWIVRGSATGNANTFGLNNAYALAANHPSQANAIAIDGSNRMFVTGNAFDAAGNDHWITRLSTNNGGAWTTVDDYQPSGGTASGTSIAIDSAGAVYISGVARSSANHTLWKVRRSLDHGATWSEVNSVDWGAVFGLAYLSGVCISGGKLYVAGSGVSGTSEDWVVQRSTNGTTWTTADTIAQSGASDFANSCGGANAGPVFVAGSTTVGAASHWLIRTSADGVTWTTADDQAAPPGVNNAIAVRTEATGETYATGIFHGDWHVRRTHDGITWTDSDDFTLGGNGGAAVMLKYSDVQQATFVVGYSFDSANREHAIVRRLDLKGAQ